MKDVFARPTISVSQSLLPIIPTTVKIHRVSDDGERVRQNSGSTAKKNSPTANTLNAALAALRQTHAAEIAAATSSIAADYASRRSSVIGQIEAEFACKIAAALMFGLPDARQSAIANLKREQAAKTNAEMARLAGEQRAAQQNTLSIIHARHAGEHKTLQSLMTPVRPMVNSSARFIDLKTPHNK